MASAAICMGISAIYHLFFVYSHGASNLLMKLDYTGIVILCFGSAVPPTMYTFACNEVAHLRNIFMIILSVSSLTVFIVSNLSFFGRANLKWLRGLLFVVFGISVALPVFYARLNFQSKYMLDINLIFFIIGGAFYILGAVLYSTRVPERCKPGAYDICGHSHQIFHFCVFIGALIHYYESLKVYHLRQSFFCPIS